MEIPEFAARFRWMAAVADLDLVAHGTTSDAETIKDTAVAQPLIVAAGLVSLLALFPQPVDGWPKVGVGAGHSVGEITAAAGAGVLTAEQAMAFVRERGRGMAAAAAQTPTGMSAVLGGDPEQVLSAIETAGLTPANVNAAGQVVAAGELDRLTALKAEPPARTRVMPLQVAGAFHTAFMAPAKESLAGYARAMTTRDPKINLLSNADGGVVQHGQEALQRLVTQVTSPVRWDLCMATMVEMGVTAVIEIPPAGTLVGLAKRAMPGVETLALKTPEDLPAAHDLIARHGSAATDLAVQPSWKLIVAPAKGTIRLDDAHAERLEPGAHVARVEGLRDGFDVHTEHGGTVVEWLVEDGDPVSPGQPVVRLHPDGVRA